MRVGVHPVRLGDEWLLLELQGLLETRETDESLAGLTLGSLTVKNEQQVPFVTKWPRKAEWARMEGGKGRGGSRCKALGTLSL